MASASAIVPKPALAVPRAVKNETPPSPAEVAKLRKAAQDFESVFLNHMLKTMRQSATSGPGMGGRSGERMYRDLLDDELAKSIAKSGGLGLADVLVRDLVRSLAREMGGPEMAPQAAQAKGATPPSDSPGQRPESPGEPGALLDTLREEKKASSLPAGGPIPDNERHGPLETEPR